LSFLRSTTFALTLLALGWQSAKAECQSVVVTAFSAEDYPGLTATGIPTSPNVGRIVAGGGAYELGQTVWVEGLGTFEVADRGRLGWSQIDYLVGSHDEAVAFGRQVREVCS
jgi:3D (Asp-Asp-Asp) domain-containing protein